MARKKATPTATPGRRSERLDAKTKLIEEKKAAATAAAAARDHKPKTKPKRRPRQRKNCHLLNLPGELRNRIYEFAVVEDVQPVIVTSKGPGEPSLLWACRRIRSEAGSLYYGSNNFRYEIEKYNGAEFLPFKKQARRFRTFHRDDAVTFRFDLEPHWDNLVKWIEAHYLQDADIPHFNEPLHAFNVIPARVFGVVNGYGGWSAERRKMVLDMLYDILRGNDSEWVKAEDKFF